MVALVFAAAILLSAALMFIVELMFAKMVLPRLGGSPSVWNTCLVFYQIALMAGYVYAHLSVKWLGARRQALVHLVLLCLPWIVLPIGISAGWTRPGEGNPIPWLLMLLTACVGLPFFCISASAPLLQAWFAHCGGRSAKDPYFLYAASNFGSLAGLAAYPLLIEPRLPLAVQTHWWTIGYALLMALFGLCAIAVWFAARRPAAAEEPILLTAAEEPARSEDSSSLPEGFHTPVTWLRRLWWVAQALVPSALLMGITTQLSVDISPRPMVWAIPLGLYLLSFIVVFARWPILKWLWLVRIFQAAGLAAAMSTVYLSSLDLSVMKTKVIVCVGALHLAAFFLTALVCHGAMAADRPASKHLTEYYLWMSAGGVAGGLICALVAPLVFNSVLEYPLMLVAACLLRPPPRLSRYERLWRWSDLALMMMQGSVFAFAAGALWHKRLAGMSANWHSEPLQKIAKELTSPTARVWWVVAAAVLAFLLQRRRGWFTVAVATLLGVCVICDEQEGVIYSTRSFFGVLRVETEKYWPDNKSYNCHALMHGSTMHGKQSHDLNDPDEARNPWTYYDRTGPVGAVFDVLESRDAFLDHGHIGVVGLGTGTVAAYAKPGQSLTYFEIDAAVRKISEDPRYFTYLSDCRQRGASLEVRMGDARLTLEDEPDGKFDLLVIDAFTSDAIPIHLLTCEAIDLYVKKLAPHGLLMVHLSNRHLTLPPVVAGAADKLGIAARICNDDDEDGGICKSSSNWAVLARTPEDLCDLEENSKLEWEPLKVDPCLALWTDDYSSIVSVMNWDWLPKWPKWMRWKKAAE